MSMGEINQVKMWADQASRTYTELQSRLDALHLEHAQLLRERNNLIEERDELRREVCVWQGLDTGQGSRATAIIRGWDCFKEDGK